MQNYPLVSAAKNPALSIHFMVLTYMHTQQLSLRTVNWAVAHFGGCLHIIMRPGSPGAPSGGPPCSVLSLSLFGLSDHSAPIDQTYR